MNAKDKIKQSTSKKSPLDRFKLYFEKTHPDKYVSPTAGQRKTSRVSTLLKRAFYATTGFVLDISSAVKEIIRRVTK